MGALIGLFARGATFLFSKAGFVLSVITGFFVGNTTGGLFKYGKYILALIALYYANKKFKWV